MSNEGKILTSTLWNQSGNIYISVNGIQTKLNEKYNKYCPDLSATNPSKCVTGCTNTADAQIIYYWLEKGYEFDFTISSNDYFFWKEDNKRYYCSEISQVGEGTISHINGVLNSDVQVGNGDFIAALNYYCAVKNHSDYGSSTGSSSVSTGAYKALGFDAYIWKDRDLKYFTYSNSLYELNEVGESIWREAIEYGEVLRVGIPGHAIYMDGYRYNNELGEYEYHLNYGWGMSNATAWYTVDELRDDVQVSRFTLDLSPDIKVLVSNTREDYFGGSFSRGMERINNICNEKTTSFTFAEDIAGGTITIDSAANITSKVNVEFENFCVTVASTANTAFKSAYGMSFDMNGSAVIVNNASSNVYAVYETADAQICITLDNSYIYSGYDAKGITDIQNMLDISGGYYFENIDDSFLATVNGYSVYAGSADDVIVLDNNSAIFGSLYLGSGDNELSVSSGSLFYGNYFGTEDSLEVNLTISGSCNSAMIVLENGIYEENFFNAADGIINIFAEELAVDTGYTLFYSENSEFLDDYVINLNVFGKIYTLDYDSRRANDFYLSYDESSISLMYDPAAAEVLSIVSSNTAFTNKNITVTVEFSENTVDKYYSFDNKNWYMLDGNEVEVSKNCTVYFRGTNRVGVFSETASILIDNIDKTAPAFNISGNPVQWTNSDVVLKVNVSDGIVQYFNGTKWFTGSRMTVKENGTYKFRVTDAAGNVTEKSVVVDKIDKSAPVISNVYADITELTNKDVKVSAVFADNIGLAVKEYKINDGEWMSYDGDIVMTENGTVYFRAADAAGNTAETQYYVGNIDKMPPVLDITASTIELTSQDIILTAAANDGTVEYFDGANWIAVNTLTVKENGIYNFRVSDLAGNVTEKSIVVDNIDKKAPEITLQISEELPTNKDVTLRAFTDEENCTLLYSFDNENWFAYSELTIEENKVVYFKAFDKTGNISEKSISITNIDKSVPEIPQFSFEVPSRIGNTAVPVVLQSDEQLQWSVDGEIWSNCDSVFNITFNGTFYFRAADAAGNISEVVEVTVDNIDNVADSTDCEYMFVNSKYYSKSKVQNKKQNGIDLVYNRNAFGSLSGAMLNIENIADCKIVMLDSKVNISSGNFSEACTVSSIVVAPKIKETALSYSYSASAAAKNTLNIDSVDTGNVLFEKFANVNVSNNAHAGTLSGGRESSSFTSKTAVKNGIATVTETTKLTRSASGKVTVTSATADKIEGYATVNVNGGFVSEIVNNAYKLTETVKTVGDNAPAVNRNEQFIISGTANLTNFAEVSSISNFKTVKMSNSSVENISNVQKVTISKGFNSIGSYVGTEGNDTLTVSKGAVLFLGSAYFGYGKKDKLVNNGTVILTAGIDVADLPISGKGEIAASYGVWNEIDNNWNVLNLGATADGFRSTKYELADDTQKKAVKWDLKSDYIGWLGNGVDVQDTVDFISFKNKQGGTLVISGSGFGDYDITCNGQNLTRNENGDFIVDFAANTNNILKFRCSNEDSMSYSISLLA